jgi:hypothetical protein
MAESNELSYSYERSKIIEPSKNVRTLHWKKRQNRFGSILINKVEVQSHLLDDEGHLDIPIDSTVHVFDMDIAID